MSYFWIKWNHTWPTSVTEKLPAAVNDTMVLLFRRCILCRLANAIQPPVMPHWIPEKLRNLGVLVGASGRSLCRAEVWGHAEGEVMWNHTNQLPEYLTQRKSKNVRWVWIDMAWNLWHQHRTKDCYCTISCNPASHKLIFFPGCSINSPTLRLFFQHCSAVFVMHCLILLKHNLTVFSCRIIYIFIQKLDQGLPSGGFKQHSGGFELIKCGWKLHYAWLMTSLLNLTLAIKLFLRSFLNSDEAKMPYLIKSCRDSKSFWSIMWGLYWPISRRSKFLRFNNYTHFFVLVFPTLFF